VLSAYNIDFVTIQEVRWLDIDQLDVGEYVIQYSGTDNTHHFGRRFTIHRNLVLDIIGFRSISERILLIIMEGAKSINS